MVLLEGNAFALKNRNLQNIARLLHFRQFLSTHACAAFIDLYMFSVDADKSKIGWLCLLIRAELTLLPSHFHLLPLHQRYFCRSSLIDCEWLLLQIECNQKVFLCLKKRLFFKMISLRRNGLNFGESVVRQPLKDTSMIHIRQFRRQILKILRK